MKIGDRIKSRRIDLRLSVDDVASALGKNRATVYRYENNDIENFPTTVLEPLAEVLETTPAYLMGWTTDPYDYKKDEQGRIASIPSAIFEELQKIHHGDLSAIWKAHFDVEADLFPDQLNSKLNDKTQPPIPSNLIPYYPTGSIPILGQIPAGLAVLAVEDIEGYLAVNVNNPEECFALRVKGDSMINAGISSGDLVVIRMQQCAENGQIVACRINGDEATLKRFKQQGETVILLPENPNYEPIIVPCSEFENGYASIIGVALQVVRML